MRILRLVQCLPPELGGKEIHASLLSQELERLRYEQLVIHASGGAIPGVESKSLGIDGPRESRKTLLSYAQRAYGPAVAAHQAQPFDVVHAHGDFVEAALASALSRRLGVPAVLTVHGGLSRSSLHRQIRRASYRGLNRVIAVSDDVAGDVEQIGLSLPVSVTPSGVRQEFFEAATNTSREPNLILSVGRLVPGKGHEVLFAAAELLAEKELQWQLVGGGDDAYAQQVKQQVAGRANFQHHQSLAAKPLAQAMAQAAVFVLPSIDQPNQREGTPTVVMEALAAGARVVVSDAAGVPASQPGVEVVPAGDPVALAEAIGRAVAGEDPAAPIGGPHQSSSFAVRTWPEVAERVRSEYLRAAESTATRR